MSYRPINPSHLDAFGASDLRACQGGPRVDVERAGRSKDESVDVPAVKNGSSRAVHRWYKGMAGSALFIAGTLWMLSILGFSLPWYSAAALSAMLIGGFFMVGALNHGSATVRRDLSHDRCDH